MVKINGATVKTPRDRAIGKEWAKEAGRGRRLLLWSLALIGFALAGAALVIFESYVQ